MIFPKNVYVPNQTGWMSPEDGTIKGVVWEGVIHKINYKVDSSGDITVANAYVSVRSRETKPRWFLLGKEHLMTTYESPEIYLPSLFGDFRKTFDTGIDSYLIGRIRTGFLNEQKIVDEKFVLWVLGPAIQKVRETCERLREESLGRGHLHKVA